MERAGPITSAPGTSISYRVLDGALAFGIDVNDGTATSTQGDPDLLIDTTAGNDLGMWTNPAVLPLLLADVRAKIEAAVADQDATLDALTFSLKEGSYHITGTASRDNIGSVDFSVDAAPRLVRPGTCEEWDEEYGEHFIICTDDHDELWFEVENVEVDVDREAWLDILEGIVGVATLGLGFLVANALVEMVRNNVGAGIEGSAGGTIAARVQEFTLTGLPEPLFRLEIVTYECHTEGTYTGLNLRPLIPAPRIDGPAIVNVEQALSTTLRWRLGLPFDALADDPHLSTRWTIRRIDTNDILIHTDWQAKTNLTVDLSGHPALVVAPEFIIACRVYRTMGPVTTDLFAGTATFKVSDPLDRSHPFVSWTHHLYVPVVRVEPDGSHTQIGLDLKQRHSRIHRTAVPGRCRMVSRFSLGELPPGASALPSLHYVDTLPFPLEELPSKRQLVCDYCFFGGPTKTVPLL